MIPFRLFLLICILTLTIFAGACGEEGQRYNVPPRQSDVDAVIQGLVADIEEIAADFQGINNCADFNNLVSQIPETIQCEQGGSAAVTLEGSQCEESPSFKASVTFNLTSNSCTIDGKKTTGTLNTQLNMEGTQITGIVNATDIIIIGVRFNFNNITVPIGPDGKANNCSGTATGFDYPCTVSSDCMTCPIES